LTVQYRSIFGQVPR